MRFVNPQGRKLNLEEDRKAIKEVEDKQIIDSVQKDKENKIFPEEDKLFIKWFNANGIKCYTICCECENNKLIRAKGIRGLRCEQCNTFHSWFTWIKVRTELHRITSLNNGKIQRIKQPGDNIPKLNRGMQYNKKTKKFETKPITLGEIKKRFNLKKIKEKNA